MKVLVVSQHYFPESFAITSICEYFVQKGDSVCVVTGQPCYGKTTFYDGYEKPGINIVNGVKVIRLSQTPRKGSLFSLLKNYFSFWRSSRKYVKSLKENYDIVFSCCLSPITSVCAANLYAKKHHVKHVHYCMDIWPESAVAVGAIARKSLFYHFALSLSRSIYRKMDKIIVSSPSFTQYFREILKLNKIPIVYIPQPVAASNVGGNSFSFPKSLTFVYAGNIGSLQLVEQMVIACSKLPSNLDYSFYIFGWGSRLSSVLKLICDNNLQKHVFYGGFLSQNDLASRLNAAKCLVLGLKDDGSIVSKTIPNKLISYLSFGKPLIACMGGDGALIAKESNSAIVCGQSAELISEAFLKISKMSEKELAEMGKSGFDFYRDNFSYSFLLDEIRKNFTD
jgi:glycosyltransferase involved in cell wall biosynthesis